MDVVGAGIGSGECFGVEGTKNVAFPAKENRKNGDERGGSNRCEGFLKRPYLQATLVSRDERLM